MLCGVVGARSHLQDRADGLDSESTAVDDVVLVGLDEGDYLAHHLNSFLLVAGYEAPLHEMATKNVR